MSAILSLQFWAFIGVWTGILSIFALGLQLQFGFTGLLNLGHIAFMAISAYTMAILIVQLSVPMWLAAMIAIAVSVIAGFLVSLPALRLRADYFAITTLAFSEIVRLLAVNLRGLTGGAQGTIALAGSGGAASYNGEWQQFQASFESGLGNLVGFDVGKDVAMLLLIWPVVFLVAIALRRLVSSPWGRVLQAIREDEDATASVGKNVYRFKAQAFALGSGIAGVAGLFFAWQFAFFSPVDFIPLTTIIGYVIVILGGKTNIWGVPIGASLIALIWGGTRFFDFVPFTYFTSPERADLRFIVIGLTIVFLMVFRPQGVLGSREELMVGEDFGR